MNLKTATLYALGLSQVLNFRTVSKVPSLISGHPLFAAEKHAAARVETDFPGSFALDFTKPGGGQHQKNFLFGVTSLGQCEIPLSPSRGLPGEQGEIIAGQSPGRGHSGPPSHRPGLLL